jgi:hypothetical protein
MPPPRFERGTFGLGISGYRVHDEHYQFFQHVNTSTEYTKTTVSIAGGHILWAHSKINQG